ncbi:hypothetical protein BU26DRAFT_81718 [Trematosphaeria pertusa]|uniref:Uncharacterized protein n=1 Tax=Trematosphaeria pertusa TaxID=390896 RepID=A0A6A6I4P1_9PLEO|nr:uncharacterized protein BU26DRAFT_81718 [Trematosphaeria pertusa]KAF2244580.1 hypothetical protein BU26DRAFT_81718 [Trematosphaeria pertusa]
MEDEDIAAAMGFSSFGGTKKRKFDQTNPPRAKADASGANTTSLGVRPKAVVAEDTDEPGDTKDVDMTTDLAEAAPQSHPRPPPNTKGKQKQSAATGLASFLARGQNLPDKAPGTEGSQTTIQPVREEPSPEYMVSFGGPAIPRAELYALRNGVMDENGDTAYFLPSFVEDPWENLTKGRQ